MKERNDTHKFRKYDILLTGYRALKQRFLNKNRYSFFLIILLTVLFSCKQKNETTKLIKTDTYETNTNSYRIMFYNVENLFDTADDPEKNDEEFTPNGARFWTEARLRAKLNNIYKVITAVGAWDNPMLIGMSEVENRKVLEDLVNKTPLYKSNYKIVHYESPDLRGIDVAMLYRADLFKPYFSKPIPVNWPPKVGTGKTRDILLVSGVTKSDDTLHIFVNHWPSRWGGQMETEEKRMYVAELVKKQTDSIFRNESKANIIIMGDLNDYPTDKSLMESLKAQTQFVQIENNKLYNLSWYLQEIKREGTHKYDGLWGILDQMIVSGALLDKENNIYTTTEDAHVFKAPFLLEPDEKYTGDQVNRTYIGFKYHGGYSDHLPVYLDLKLNKK
ncbi:MAG: endonuclease [Bacteroidales bacterium]|jgi:predicted extracellular nuclease|nr:endonuclease [Bacteroidales bacterium]